jgi:hypothetical protein
MTFSRWTFLLAGLYGLLALLPGLLAEAPFMGAARLSLSQPEFYYGFFGSAILWQLVFLLISRDPVRWRALMPVCILEKLAFFLPSMALLGAGRVGFGGALIAAIIDGVLAVLFFLAWRATPKSTQA